MQQLTQRFTMPKIPRRYSHFVFSVIQSGITCAIAAAVASAPFFSEGSFAAHWARAYFTAWIIMLPVVIVVAPFIRKAAAALSD
jgi:hypothetical protein